MPLAARMLSGRGDARLSLRNMRGMCAGCADGDRDDTGTFRLRAMLHGTGDTLSLPGLLSTMLPLLVPDSEGAARAVLLLESR
jgi:hypothetical protein